MFNAQTMMMILAALCFAIAALGYPRNPPSPYSVGWLGAMFAALSFLVKS